MPYASNDMGGFDGHTPISAKDYPQFVGKTMAQVRQMAPWMQLPNTGNEDATWGEGGWSAPGARGGISSSGRKATNLDSANWWENGSAPPASERYDGTSINPAWQAAQQGGGQAPSLTGLQTAATTAPPAALPTADLSAAATAAVGGGATPATDAYRQSPMTQAQATPPAATPPAAATPAAPTSLAAPAPVPAVGAPRYHSKSSLAGLRRATKRSY